MQNNTQKQVIDVADNVDTNNSSDKNSKMPTHELVVSIETKEGEYTLGKIGLFTSNNGLHNSLKELPPEKLANLGKLLNFSIIPYGTKTSKTFTFDL